MAIALPTLPVVIATALVDSINPCAIGVLILLVAALLGVAHDKKRLLLIGTVYILAVYVTYLLAGIGLLFFIQRFNLAEPIGVGVGILIIILGFIELKDFWWYGKGISLMIPVRRSEQIKKMVKRVSLPGSIVLGIFVAAVELPCTGGPYLAITTLLAKIGLNTVVLAYLLLYNFIFVSPLIVILVIVYFGQSAKKLEKWRKTERKWMRLFTGIVMIALGILLIMFAVRIIDFTLII
jgi:cytochrome c biogenesis protein CcdA